VHLEDAQSICYVCVDKNNLASVVIADDQYPEKVAFMVIMQMFQEFYKIQNAMFIDTITSTNLPINSLADQSINIPKFEEFIKAYQDPKEVDKLMKIEATLNEVN
jgi:synaptobrevin family protein YKT6